MSVLPIRTVPDPVLKQKAKRVSSLEGSVQRLIDNMIETLAASGNGVGLAAPQVGKSLRIVVIKLPEEDVRVLVNPQIVKCEGERCIDEGCLSLPGYHGEVRRSVKVTVKAKDRKGKDIRVKGDELLAQCLEHEIDHLDGIMFTDRLVEPGKLEKVEPEPREEETS